MCLKLDSISLETCSTQFLTLAYVVAPIGVRGPCINSLGVKLPNALNAPSVQHHLTALGSVSTGHNFLVSDPNVMIQESNEILKSLACNKKNFTGFLLAV